MNILIIVFSILSIIGTLLPRHDSVHWFVRGQANFRAQYLVVNLLMLILVIIYLPYLLIKIILGILLALSVFLCIRTIAPYSILFPKTIKNAKNPDNPKGTPLHIFIHNVYQFNDNYEGEVNLILKEDPDIILLLEVNKDWKNGMASLADKYAYSVEEIRKDTYGILMMSKIKTIEESLNHLVTKKIPSTEMLLNISGQQIRILGIHPPPPIPGEVLTSKPKDDEIMSAAHYINELSNHELKILVGDFNDVAWSKVSKKFKKMTGLKDVRIGRGFFSTFPSYSPLQIPLDHVFCSPQLKLIDFRTLDSVGSDHNPVSVTFEVPMNKK